MSEIENRVKKSGLITLDLQEMLPDTSNVVELDINQFLFQGLVLREKEYRAALKELDWSTYKDKEVLTYCSADAIVPDWAYMLIASYLSPIASDMYYGDLQSYTKSRLLTNVAAIDAQSYADQRVIIKGCGSPSVDAEAYFEITKKLTPTVRSLMYGEPCSTVPIYKQKK